MNKITNCKLQNANLKFLLAIFLLFPGIIFAAGSQKIQPERVYSMIKEGSSLWLIDVRGPMAFEEKHIEGAVNIPASSLSLKQFSKQKTLVLIDDSLGQRNAAEAAELLMKKGYEKIYVMDGGINGWEGEGYPVAGAANANRINSVTPAELKMALKRSVPVKIFDMRGKDEFKKGSVSGSVSVDGNDIPGRVAKLKEMLKKPDKKDIAKRLEKAMPIVLIFSASDDAAGIMQGHMRKGVDIRYLQGGYEAWQAMDGKRAKKTVGDCNMCPGKKSEDEKVRR